MKILFLTNNLEVTHPLLEWLRRTEGFNNVVLCSDLITGKLFMEDEPFHGTEYIVSYNYAHIIMQDVIQLFLHRIINLHISMLPWNRGVSPNIWSFIEGTPAGVTIHEIDKGIDTGDILLQREIVFDFEIDTLKSSYEKSHALILKLFCENWEKLKNSQIAPTPQNKAEGTTHFLKDSQVFDQVICYGDTITEFLSKCRNNNCSRV